MRGHKFSNLLVNANERDWWMGWHGKVCLGFQKEDELRKAYFNFYQRSCLLLMKFLGYLTVQLNENLSLYLEKHNKLQLSFAEKHRDISRMRNACYGFTL